MTQRNTNGSGSGRTSGMRVIALCASATVLGVGLLIAGVAIAQSPPAQTPAATQITIDNFSFSPQELTVTVGTKVTWVNHDDIPHNVVDKTKKFRSKALDSEDSYSFTFDTAGTFDYICGLHPFMNARIVVKPPGA